MKIKPLTPAQQELIPAIRDKWLNKLFGCNRRIDRARATEGINWLYEFSGLQKLIQIRSKLRPRIRPGNSPGIRSWIRSGIRSRIRWAISSSIKHGMIG